MNHLLVIRHDHLKSSVSSRSPSAAHTSPEHNHLYKDAPFIQQITSRPNTEHSELSAARVPG